MLQRSGRNDVERGRGVTLVATLGMGGPAYLLRLLPRRHCRQPAASAPFARMSPPRSVRRDGLSLAGAGQQPVVPDAVEAVRQDVDEEAADELARSVMVL
jgi:hypothetical protein